MNNGIWDTATNTCLYAIADYIGNDTILHQGNIDLLMSNSLASIKDDGHFCGYQPAGTVGENETRIFTHTDLMTYNLGGTPSQVAGDIATLQTTFPELISGRELIVNTKDCTRNPDIPGWNTSTYPNGYYYRNTNDGSITLPPTLSIQYQ